MELKRIVLLLNRDVIVHNLVYNCLKWTLDIMIRIPLNDVVIIP